MAEQEKEKLVLTTLRLEFEHWKKLRVHAFEQGQTMTSLIREIFSDWVEKKDGKEN